VEGYVKLISNDGQEFIVGAKVAMMNAFVVTKLEAGERTVVIDTVTGKTLSKVLEYCVYHTTHPSVYVRPQKLEDRRSDDIIPWDLDFCKVDQATLFELILAAEVLKNVRLLNLTCKTVANMFNGKTAEEIGREFNIKNDFTPDEEEETRKELSEWMNAK
jgi:S-phase kinase-associated protein 1